MENETREASVWCCFAFVSKIVNLFQALQCLQIVLHLLSLLAVNPIKIMFTTSRKTKKYE